MMSGCTSVPKVVSGERITIETASAMRNFSDDRETNEKVERTLMTKTESAYWFADDAFSPPLPNALSGVFAERLGNVRMSSFVLLEARIGAFKLFSRASADIYRKSPALRGAAIGEAFLRTVVGEAQALSDADPEQWAAEIGVKIDGERYASYKSKGRSEGQTQATALRELIDECVRDIVAEHKKRHPEAYERR
jgi:hypothetical protein